MSRTWTTKAFIGSDQFKASDFSSEANAEAQQVNGKLGQNNLPLDSVVGDKLVDGIVQTNAYGDNTKSSYLPTQSYHVNTFISANETTEADVVGAPEDYNTNWSVNSWDPFWNSFETENSTLKFVSREGMIYGDVNLSGERRIGRVHYTPAEGPGATVFVGHGGWWRIGVFVNGVLVADTGEIQVGGYSIDLPFSTPIGSEYCEVEVKWMANQDLYQELTGIGSSIENADFQKFVCAGIHVFARNQYR